MTATTYQPGEIRGLIEIDASKCKGCDACQKFCPTNAIEGSSGAPHSINIEKCLSCGQCLINCPFSAIKETHSALDDVIKKLHDNNTTVVGIIAPAVRVAIGEEFGLGTGELVTGKLYGAMNKAGFKIFDCNFAADLTIMEEGSEFIHRLHANVKGEPNAGALPQFTSCCPGWVRYVETRYPNLLPNLSTAKSPQQMAGTVAKTYGAKVYDMQPEKIFTVAVMPCTSKKLEASRPEFNSAWQYHQEQGANLPSYQDIDAVLTTREMAELLKVLDIDLATTPAFEGDSLFSEYTGAGTIFGTTGGVMEAALRTAHKVLTGNEMAKLEFNPVRGLEGVKTASVTLHDTELSQDVTINVAVVHDMGNNIEPILRDIMAGTSPYHFIEVMNCAGGCVNGGGQPIDGSGSSWLGNI
ncbi:iron hydrogenase large subunit HydA [Shewanella sp. D64]|uniref:iron hydrogenase large subunit HydA n=1 Tax=unclassified Shewanella TaxID=196818 RepID=UPI0022BA6D88|nr:MULTISPECIES: iron hydrogenase large subunit HydA [unclassified Shewanella]MEC4727894.1 iron hydrogenase large subunit HydA [Shewanella sp. D64]MEC4739936.1 iron hydrogenase large subunit HydA [Shewanella sp. E94]WBJ97102.1 iron hydrogenase large subunit HydA [Shewanella sp. MTB7]